MEFRFEPDIAVVVRKYDKALEFYQRVLGMRLIRQDETETVLWLPGATFYFEDGGDEPPPRPPTTFCFVTDDFRAAEEQLYAEGCRLSAVVDGGRMVHDPYGLAFFLCPAEDIGDTGTAVISGSAVGGTAVAGGRPDHTTSR